MPSAKINVLLVDDESSIRNLLSEVFSQLGHGISAAEDGFSALQRIRQTMPDVIVSDLNMPGMSGFELLSVIRRRFPSIYVIATSGAYCGEAVPRGVAADAFYEKGSGIRLLLRLVDIAIGKADIDSFRNLNDPVPVWVSQVETGASQKLDMTICCPECLRAVTLSTHKGESLIHQVVCKYCRCSIRYAIVEPLDPATSQPVLHAPPQEFESIQMPD